MKISWCKRRYKVSDNSRSKSRELGHESQVEEEAYEETEEEEEEDEVQVQVEISLISCWLGLVIDNVIQSLLILYHRHYDLQRR